MRVMTTVGLPLVASLNMVIGCSVNEPDARRSPHMPDDHAPPAEEAQTMRVELLGLPDCPNTPTLRANLEAAIARLDGVENDISIRVIDVNQQALPKGDARRGYPAPTILINGRDLFGLPTPTEPAAACRIYPGGLPSSDELADRLARERSH